MLRMRMLQHRHLENRKKTQHGKEWRQHDRGRAASLSLTAKAEDVVLVKIVLSPVLIGRVVSITVVPQSYCKTKAKKIFHIIWYGGELISASWCAEGI